MELETSIGYSFSLIKTEYKQNKIYQNKKKTKRTVNLSFQSALCQQSERNVHDDIPFFTISPDYLNHLSIRSCNSPLSFIARISLSNSAFSSEPFWNAIAFPAESSPTPSGNEVSSS